MQGMADEYDLIVANFANGDVIGHTSNNAAKLKCAAIVDHHLGHVVEAALSHDYVVFITADHGNLEEMKDAHGTPHVSHTTNPVEFIVVDPRSGPLRTLLDGCLADVAPTIITALGIEKPAAMSGENSGSRA